MDTLWRRDTLGDAGDMFSVHEDGRAWQGMPMSPKAWASVELPDMFLSNLFDSDAPKGADDSLTDFSGSAGMSGSEEESSPGAFQEFMMHASPPASLPSDTPEPASLPLSFDAALLQGAPPQPVTHADPMSLFAPIFELPAQAPCVDSISPASMHSGAAPPATMAPPTTEAPPAAAPPPSSSTTDLEALGTVHMAPGSNANAQTALARLRAAIRPAADSGARTSRPAARTLPSTRAPAAPAADGEPTMWSRKIAHNAIERRYRSNINDRIAGLRDVVPALRAMRPRSGRRKRRRSKAEEEELVDGVAAATKLSKATVLTKATEYICYLKSREVQLSREVAGLHMLLRSMEGGDELIAQWNVEMERVNTQNPPMDAVYGDVPKEPAPLEWDADDDADDDDTSLESSERPSKAPRYLLSALAVFSLAHTDVWAGDEASARVVGAGHQLLRRTTGTDASQALDTPALAWCATILRLATTVFFVGALCYALWVRTHAAWRHSARRRAVQLQAVFDVRALLRTPLEHVQATPLASRADAQRVFVALGEALDVPRSHVALGVRLAAQVAVAAALYVPGVAAAAARISDATAALVERRGWTRRLELDASLGLARPVWHRAYAALRLHNLCVVHGHTNDEAALLALVLYSVAAQAPPLVSAWLAEQSTALWHATAAKVAVGGVKVAQELVDVLSVPLPLASDYAQSGHVTPADVPVMSSPLGGVLDGLQREALASFWAALLASMMRASKEAAAGGDDADDSACLAPAVLDVVSDRASLHALRAQLVQIAHERPVRSALGSEQLLVAHGVLALVAGRMEQARYCARRAACAPLTSAAQQLCALVLDECVDDAEPVHAVDVLATAAVRWLRLQHAAAARRGTGDVAHDVAALQQLVSQCVWTFVAPSPAPLAAKTAPRPRVPSLTATLDTLTDQLSSLASVF